MDKKRSWFRDFIGSFKTVKDNSTEKLNKSEEAALAEIIKVQNEVHEKHRFVEKANVNEEQAKENAKQAKKTKTQKTLGTI